MNMTSSWSADHTLCTIESDVAKRISRFSKKVLPTNIIRETTHTMSLRNFVFLFLCESNCTYPTVRMEFTYFIVTKRILSLRNFTY